MASGTKTANAFLLGLLVGGALGAGCKRDQGPSDPPSAAPATLSNPACPHAVCGDGYFVDVAPGALCAANETCTLALTLVATGEYHINDEYPYKFKGDDDASVEFQGKSADGKAIFSKASGDWTKSDEKTGRMSVAFTPRGPQERGASERRIAGVFKLSVCSTASCRLEAPRVEGRVVVR